MRFPLSLILLVACSGPDDDTNKDTEPDPTGTDACVDGVCILSGTYTEDLHFTPDFQWVLRGGVFIGDDQNETVLTIDPGTTVYGESSTDGMLVVTRNSKILAQGTASDPIVFTSSKEPGTRARGDWGGLIINGKAPINACTDEEGACEAFGEGGTGWYGGDDPNDDSGVLQYVRVEFAGTLVSPDNELNGIAFQGVGSGTTIDYVQIHMNADDGVEFFGGTAEGKHILVTGVADDSLDWTDGWQGKLQYVVLEQYDDAGDNGIEADNNGENNDQTPRSAPMISNVTILGVESSADSDIGMLLREGTAATLANVLVEGMGDACLDIDHAATFTQVGNGDLTIEYSALDCATTYSVDDEKAPDPLDVAAWFEGSPGNVIGPAPAGGGQALSDAFFDAADFIGGIDPADDWTAGWTISERN